MADRKKPTRDFLRSILEPDFFFHENWEGIHKHNGELVRYDIVSLPRPHLLKNGFDDGFVIIEVKLFKKSDKKKHDTKAKDLLWQCIAYSYSEVSHPQHNTEKPLFVLYFIDGDGIEPLYQDKLALLHGFVQRGGVGRLDINRQGQWSMVFGGSYYFRQLHGRGPHNVGTKRMTGSSR
jgi:hypothetical protein